MGADDTTNNKGSSRWEHGFDSEGSGRNGGKKGYFGNSSFNDYGYKTYEKDSDEIDLSKLMAMLLRRKWTVIGLTLLGLGLAWLYAASQIPVYQSEGTILITETQQRMGSGSDLEGLLASSYGLGVGSRIANEMQVLRTRQLSMNIAERLLAEQTMQNGNMFPILFTEYPEDSTVASAERIASRVRLNMQVQRKERDSDVVSITFRSYSPLEAKWLVDQSIEAYRALSTEQNRMAASAALRFLETERDQVEQKLAETEANMRAFMQNTGLVRIDSQTERVIGRLSDLESRRQEIETQLVAVNSAVVSFQRQLDQIRPGLAERFAQSVAPTLERYQFRLAELETERLLYITRNPDLRNSPETEPELVQINRQIAMLKQEINDLASQMIGDDGDDFLSFLSSSDGNIASRVSEIRDRLINLQVEQTQYRAQRTAIEERLIAEEGFFDNLPDNMVELAGLRRDVDINESLFETISRQYAETALWEQTQFGLGRPMDYGYVPGSPIEPKIPMLLMIGLLLGGIAGVGLALIRETMNRTIDGVTKLREAGVPVLAVIPDLKPFIDKQFKGAETVTLKGKEVSTGWVALLDSLSPAAEAYRRLHNNIIYSHPDEKFQTIVITSSSQGEGKTTLAANLATTLAESGKRVLLMDMDLRRPRMHKLTGVKRSPGLLETLFDDVPLQDVIKKTLNENVYILPCGKKAPNPSSISQSKKLTDLFYRLRKNFDHIIVDTAPYGIITDAAPMVRLADGVVVVTRFGLTDKRELAQTLENLENIRANVVGTVLTSYSHKSSADYHYYTNNYRYQYYYNHDKYEAYREDPAVIEPDPGIDEELNERTVPRK